MPRHLNDVLYWQQVYILILIIVNIVTIKPSIIILGLLIPSFIVIWKLSPIVHENNPVRESDLYRHRQYSIIISIFIMCTVIIFVLIKQYTLSLVLSLGFFQVSISLLFEKIKGGVVQWISKIYFSR